MPGSFGRPNPTRFHANKGLRSAGGLPKIPILSLRLSIAYLACVAALCAAPAGAKRSGYVISTEGGIEGPQSVRYDAEGRPMDGFPVKPTLGGAVGTPLRRVAPAGGAVVPTAPELPVPETRGLTTADGRPVPFALSSGRKGVDDAVDFNSALRKAGKTNDLLGKKYDTSMAPVGKEQVYSRNNLLTLDSWHGRYDTYGRKKSDLVLEDSLGAQVRPKDMMEVKSIDRITAPINGEKAELRSWETRMGVAQNPKYASTVRSGWDGVLNQGPKTVDELSMQDINRYQFRRNRSSEPGTPFVRPGSEEIKTKGAAK